MFYLLRGNCYDGEHFFFAIKIIRAHTVVFPRCVGSCTAYLEEISSQEESIKNVGMLPFDYYCTPLCY